MITEKQYVEARRTFGELCKVLDGQKSKWFERFGYEMPDDYISFEMISAIDECFGTMMRYRRQKEKAR